MNYMENDDELENWWNNLDDLEELNRNEALDYTSELLDEKEPPRQDYDQEDDA